jgi:hypothetical protein
MTNATDFNEWLERVQRAAFTSSRMPAKVFRPGYGKFQFLDFDLFAGVEFWVMLQKLMAGSHDDRVGLLILDPKSEGFGALEIPASLFAEQYTGLLQSPSLTDSVLINSMVLVCAPPSLRWLIWGERIP